jgi:hypothetical protein
MSFESIRGRRLAVLAVSGASPVATVGAGGILPATASADRVINGCTIVDHATTSISLSVGTRLAPTSPAPSFAGR